MFQFLESRELPKLIQGKEIGNMNRLKEEKSLTFLKQKRKKKNYSQRKMLTQAVSLVNSIKYLKIN